MQELYELHFCAVYNSGLSVQANWYDAARLAADEASDPKCLIHFLDIWRKFYLIHMYRADGVDGPQEMERI